jgi:hypothetical protein
MSCWLSPAVREGGEVVNNGVDFSGMVIDRQLVRRRMRVGGDRPKLNPRHAFPG